jgi:hypothetical protein
MMSHKRVGAVVVSSLILTSLIPSPLFARHKDSRTTDIITGAVVVGGVAAGLYALGSWLFSSTDEQVQDKARSALHDARQRYEKVVALLEREFNVDSSRVGSATEADLQRKASEAFLASLADEIFATTATVDQYCSDLRYIRDSLDKQHTEVLKRARKSRCENMFALARDLDDQRARLAVLHHMIKHHTSYFALDAVETSLHGRYSDAIAVLDSCGADMRERIHQLRTIVARYGSAHRSVYPYLDYVDQITHDKRTLDEHIRRAAYTYPTLMADAQRLSAQLDTVANEIMADSEYTRSLRDRERELLAQERLRLEQERLHLEREAQRQRDILIAQQRADARERARLARERELLALESTYYHPPRPHAELYVEFDVD